MKILLPRSKTDEERVVGKLTKRSSLSPNDSVGVRRRESRGDKGGDSCQPQEDRAKEVHLGSRGGDGGGGDEI